MNATLLDPLVKDILRERQALVLHLSQAKEARHARSSRPPLLEWRTKAGRRNLPDWRGMVATGTWLRTGTEAHAR
jgi:hypothetical protein